jgi:hypothetical protein
VDALARAKGSFEETLNGMPRPRAYREFWNALQDGEFARDGKTRVLLLNPTRTWARLTPERGRWSLETHGWDTFVSQILSCSWIEIELADHWLAGWVPRDLHQRWVTTCASAVRTHSDAAGGVSPTQIAPPVAADGGSDLVPSGSRTNRAARAEEECERWLRALTERPKNRGAAFEAAKAACKEIGPLSMKAFDRVWPRAVPAAWREPGARKGSRKSPRS